MKETIRTFHFLGFHENLYLSTTGTVTAVYKFSLPPVYSLSYIDYNVIYDTFKDAFIRIEGENILVHRQDIFLRKKYNTEELDGDSYLSISKVKRFSDCEYIEHRCFLSFSIRGLSSLEKAYIENPLKFDKHLHVQDQKKIKDFGRKVDAVIAKLNDVSGFHLEEINPNELKEYLYNYYSMFSEKSIVRDFKTEDDYLTNYDKKVCGFVLSDEEQLPASINLYSKNRKFKSKTATNEDNELKFLQTFFLEDLGINLHYSHVLNQFWMFDKDYIKRFEMTVNKTKRYRMFSKDLQLSAETLDKLLTDLKHDRSVLCEYGMNILLIEDNEHYDDAKEEIEDICNVLLPKLYQPMGSGLDNLFFGSMIGFENKLNPAFFFLTDLDTALCFNTVGSEQKGDEQGIIFNERNTNTPIKVDLWNKPFGVSINARNGVIVSGTGGGKSVLALNIFSQFVENGIKVIVLEIGSSFQLLTEVYKEKAAHIKYSANSDIGFNPFTLPDGELRPSEQQKEDIADLIVRFLQQESLKIDNQAQKNTIKKLIDWYYMKNKNEKQHSFDTFYQAVEKEKFAVNESFGNYFDVERFLLICKDFTTGGQYEKLARKGDNSIFEKDLIVIELSDIKNNKFLFGFLMYTLTMLIDNILLNRGINSVLFIDEYGEIQDKKAAVNDGFNIHATVAYCYQKLRKENGAAYIAIQHPRQLKDDNYTQTILTQHDLLFIPQTTDKISSQAIEVFGIESPTMQNQLYSMSSNIKDTNLRDRYSETFIKVRDSYSSVVRLALSEEQFFCFQTEGDIWQRMVTTLKEGYDIKNVVANEIKLWNNNKTHKEEHEPELN